MAARARHRLERSKSCEVPRRARSFDPPPGCIMFDNDVYESFKASLCDGKKIEDKRSGPLDTSPPPRPMAVKREPELDNVIHRDILADWVTSLCDFKAEYEAEERSDPWMAPVVHEKAKPRMRTRSPSPIGPPRHMQLAMEIPDKTEEIKAALFGPEVHPSRTPAMEQPSIVPDYRRFAKQRSMSQMLTVTNLFP